MILLYFLMLDPAPERVSLAKRCASVPALDLGFYPGGSPVEPSYNFNEHQLFHPVASKAAAS